MESLPELENHPAAQDRPRSKWKRSVFWGAFVLLVLANLYFVAIYFLPRWVPRFAAEYVRHPTALARAVTTQLEAGDSHAAYSSIEEIYTIWFAPRDAKGHEIFTPWAQRCFRDFFRRGGKWERLAIIYICQEFSCPDCFDLIAAEIPNLDYESKLMAISALVRMKIYGVVPELEIFPSDSDRMVRLEAVDVILKVGYSLTETHDKTRALDLLRGVLSTETDESVREFAVFGLAELRRCYGLNSPSVLPDE